MSKATRDFNCQVNRPNEARITIALRNVMTSRLLEYSCKVCKRLRNIIMFRIILNVVVISH